MKKIVLRCVVEAVTVDLTYDKLYEVVEENQYTYYLVGDKGHRETYHKSYFEVYYDPNEKHEKKYPTTIEEVKGRKWSITNVGRVIQLITPSKDINDLSTESRAKAFLALMQLVEYRDAWNEIDGFVVDWDSGYNQDKYIFKVVCNELEKYTAHKIQSALYFGSEETRDKFMEQFSDLIEEAKELL